MVKDENRPGKYGVYKFNVFVHIETVMVNLGTLNLTLEIITYNFINIKFTLKCNWIIFSRNLL